MIIKLAWRNLWRNKRRTFITLASVFFAVILVTFMMSMKEGIYKRMIDTMIGSYTGFAQVHKDGYWDNKNLDNSFNYSDTLVQALAKEKRVTGHAPRVESFALAASDDITKGSMVVGIDPDLEVSHTGLDKQVSEGEYLTADDQSVLLGEGLAENLKLGVGDTIVMISQGYHSMSAAGKYPVKGIIKFGSPELSKQLIVLPIKEADRLFSLEGRITNLVLLMDDPGDATSIAENLGAELGDRFEVMDWMTLMPDLVEMIEADRVEGYVFMLILYMVISFGIFGTVLMMLAERQHEFGVLVAVGMKRRMLSIVVWLEVVIISLLGAFFGMLGAFPVAYILYAKPYRFGGEQAQMMEEYGMEPVLQTSLDPGIFIEQAVVVGLVASVIAIYPLIKLTRLNAIKAMRS